MTFAFVPPEELEKHRAFFERGVKVTFGKCGNPAWTVDDIWRHIQEKRAGFYRRDDGFVVLEMCAEQFSGRKYLNVWLAWFIPNRAKRIRAEFIQWLDAMKETHGCEWIEFSSPRNWTPLIAPDFQPHMTIWRRK